MKREPVGKYERRKARFLTEYRALCEEYRMMVILADDFDDDYSMFAVGIAPDPDLFQECLDKAMLEMTLEPVFKLADVGDQDDAEGEGAKT